ncbi:hypothetical protein DMB37_28135 [Nocardia sp. CS682]|nr:hypothetical protein DMB37_28135 [Nocardia sp. CS682]
MAEATGTRTAAGANTRVAATTLRTITRRAPPERTLFFDTIDLWFTGNAHIAFGFGTDPSHRKFFLVRWAV